MPGARRHPIELASVRGLSPVHCTNPRPQVSLGSEEKDDDHGENEVDLVKVLRNCEDNSCQAVEGQEAGDEEELCQEAGGEQDGGEKAACQKARG